MVSVSKKVKYELAKKWAEEEAQKYSRMVEELEACLIIHPNLNVPLNSKCGILASRIRREGYFIRNDKERGLSLHSRGFKLHSQNSVKNEQYWEEYFKTSKVSVWR